MTKWLIICHLVFPHAGLNHHLDVGCTLDLRGNARAYAFEEECVRDATIYNAMYGGPAADGVITHAFCKPVRFQ